MKKVIFLPSFLLKTPSNILSVIFSCFTLRPVYAKATACLLVVLFAAGCRKDDEIGSNEGHALTLEKMRHNWVSISTRIVMEDGRSYKLLKDFCDFKENGTKISGYKQFLDTAVYELLPGDKQITFNSIKKGVLEDKRYIDTATILTLTDHLFVYYFKRKNGSMSSIDSLKR